MNAEFFWLKCAGCRLSWKLSLLECETAQAVACPFCGNQHFGRQEIAPGALMSENDHEDEDAVKKARRLLNNDSQFNWL